MIELMETEGFPVRSFAYPFGLRNDETDSLLLPYFDMIRGVSRGIFNSISSHDCYFEYSPVVYGRGLDRHDYPNFDDQDYEQYLIDLLSHARDNNKILIVYAHIPVENITGDHQIDISTLTLICNFIEEYNMKYYTLSELKKMLK
jgi:hypothetical protein